MLGEFDGDGCADASTASRNWTKISKSGYVQVMGLDIEGSKGDILPRATFPAKFLFTVIIVVGV